MAAFADFLYKFFKKWPYHMNIKQQLAIRSTVLKSHVNKYAMLGLVISIGSIIVASLLVSYQTTGEISLGGFLKAQASNPAIWALDLTPFMFAYWGQSFCYELVSKAESIIENKTREIASKSDDLELKLKYESNHDRLTNLPNSHLLSQRINQGIQQLHSGEELALIILKINKFKEINYNFGSFSANSLLVQFAEKLKSILLEPYMLQAYMGMNMVARIQGAEFAILIPRLKEEHQLDRIIHNLIQATSVSFMIDGNNIEVTTTAGVVLHPQHGNNDEQLMQRATLGLLDAEERNKSYAIYQANMEKNYKTKRTILKELRSAIEQEEIGILHQPIVELATGKILGADVGIHFENIQYGNFDVEKLIPLVGGSSLVKNLTVFTLKNAIRQLALWHQANHKIYIQINIFNATDPDLPDILNNLLKENNLSPDYLKIELTEKACLSDQERSMDVLKRLADLGIKICISDFASGYSSFVYLINFPISEIKIDKAFISNMMKDTKRHHLVEAIIKLGEVMDLNVIADGIFDENTLNELKNLGCLYGQGEHFSNPVDADHFSKLLNRP
ncbi:diguanylate cyclase GGDEF domain protein [Legionella oakridgensis ATCC 33761 = DSM 21215]|uniref:Diguanylate cyclase GGDEF domain protein n=3 Tax=Legionella oakridgensis TaxID=29423 RepID=W0BBV4_9GAMM|nr:diguanylate cyclase GGDEF domain protein [Legionella oakridgensis ATCC 33761 = DSM 21215]KTD43916.1 diguanylate cyclase/phosphodiesterase domain 2 [Legionella oakridgensis]STY16084.1 diguanylate cyclase/phosphodiesterase domain-containing protein [Legionella longbeachae]